MPFIPFAFIQPGRATSHPLAVPLLAAMGASGVCVGLILARVLWTGKLYYGFLAWNLFLAWLPLVFALTTMRLAQTQIPTTHPRRWRRHDFKVALSFCAWLLLFPNAPYILTDLVHLNRRMAPHFWVDLVLVLCCAITGLVLGFLSLFLLHGLVARRFGRVRSWLFVLIAIGLSGFGVYLGRFLRFNSWDVVARPHLLARGIWDFLANPEASVASGTFPFLFALLLLMSYGLLYALTHLPRVEFQKTNMP